MSMSVRIRYFKTFSVPIFKNRQRLTDTPEALIHTTSIKHKSIPFRAGKICQWQWQCGAKWLFLGNSSDFKKKVIQQKDESQLMALCF